RRRVAADGEYGSGRCQGLRFGDGTSTPRNRGRTSTESRLAARPLRRRPRRQSRVRSRRYTQRRVPSRAALPRATVGNSHLQDTAQFHVLTTGGSRRQEIEPLVPKRLRRIGKDGANSLIGQLRIINHQRVTVPASSEEL